MVVMVGVSLVTRPPVPEQTAGIIWNRRYAKLPPEEKKKSSGWKDYRIWWTVLVLCILSIYGYFLWFRFQHP